MRRLGVGLAMLLTGCGGQDRFAAGTWAVEAWMESDAGSGRGNPQTHQAHRVNVSRQDRSRPPVAVFFTRFYGREDISSIRFENGRIEGSFEQRRVDDIAGHTVPVSGTYSRERFHATLEFTAFGAKVRQVVQGRLVEPPS